MNSNDTIAPPLNGSSDQEGKDKILRAALAEFCAFGFAGSRVDRIGKVAGMNKAMLYYYFESKAGLHRATISHFATAATRAVAHGATSSMNLKEMLAQIAGIYIDLFRSQPELIRVLLHELADGRHESIEILAQSIIGSGLPAEVARRFGAEMREGRMRQMDIAQTHISFMMMIFGYFLLSPLPEKVWNIEDRHAFLEKRKEAIVDLFLNGIAA